MSSRTRWFATTGDEQIHFHTATPLNDMAETTLCTDCGQWINRNGSTWVHVAGRRCAIIHGPRGNREIDG